MKNHRIGFIELLRFIFSVFVMLYHCSYININNIQFFSNSYIAVEFFFILSGYFTIKSINEKYKISLNIWQCIKLTLVKFKKIYLYVIFSLFFLIIFYSIIFNWSYYIIIQQFLSHIFEFLLLQVTGLQGNYLNLYIMPLWFLSVLLIITPIFIYFYSKNENLMDLLCCIIPIFGYGFLMISYGTLNVWSESILGIPFAVAFLRGISGFSLGIIIFEINNNYSFFKMNSFISSCISGGLLSIIFLFLIFDINIMDTSIVLLIFIFLLLLFSNTSYFTLKLFNSKFFLFLGSLSLPIYVFHTVSIVLVEHFFANNPYSLLYYLLITVLFSIILDNLITTILNKLKKQNYFSKD